MAEVAEVEDGVVIIGCVAIFYEQGEGGEHYRNYINVVYFSVKICEKLRTTKIFKKTWTSGA